MQVIELDIAADLDPEWLAWPRAREQWAWRLGTARIELDDVVGHHVGVVAAGHLDKRRQPVGVHEVVAVHDGDPFALGKPKRSVARGSWSSIMTTPHQANSRVFRHQSRHYRDTV